MVLGGGGLAAAGSIARPFEPGAPLRGPLFDVREFGAVGDGYTDDTRAIQRALDAAHEVGGGVVQLPAGTWRAGTLALRSQVTVDLGPGAMLLASPDDDDFAPHERLPFTSGSDVETIDFAHALLAGRDLVRVAIVGSGVIHMNRDRRHGPKPIALKRCRFVTVRGISIVHSPNYCVSLGGCEDVLVDGVVIRAGYADGIDPDCCRRVRISNCDVESDDDALCLKASFLLGTRGVTEDVVVTNCRLRSPSNCFKLGTESTGDFRRITLSNCVFSGEPPPDRDASAAAEGGGIALLTVDGGTIDGVVISNVMMSEVLAPLFVRLGNRGRDQPAPLPGRLRNVTISGVIAVGASATGSIAGLPDHPIERVTIDNLRITGAGAASRAPGLDVPERPADYPKVTMYGPLPASGLYLRHARDVTLRNLDLSVEQTDRRPALVADDVTGLHLAGFSGGSRHPEGPLVWLNDVRGGIVQGSLAPGHSGVFLRVTGASTKGVAVDGNAYWTSGPVDLAPEPAPTAVQQATGNRAAGVTSPPARVKATKPVT